MMPLALFTSGGLRIALAVRFAFMIGWFGTALITSGSGLTAPELSTLTASSTRPSAVTLPTRRNWPGGTAPPSALSVSRWWYPANPSS